MDYTAEEFKKANPKYRHLEGDELWDAMTNHVLRQQDGEDIIKTTLPFLRRYTLRWLFYRKTASMMFNTHGYEEDLQCFKCKRASNVRMGFMESGKRAIEYCLHCRQEYIPELNTSLSHGLYKLAKWISKLFWTILDRIHLVRSANSGRYDMFGDEVHYVAFWKTYKMTPVLKSRKWWEYIFIIKP